MEAIRVYLKEIRDIPLLNHQQEIDLSNRALKGDEMARKEMIRANLRLVINIAKRYLHLGIPLLDLIEEGNLGLMKAVDRFKPDKGFRFSTYAAWWIKQAITRSISDQGKLIRVPVYMNDLIAKWKKTKERLSQRNKRIPSDEEIAKKMRISEEKMERITFWLSSKTSSLEAKIGDEEGSVIMDLIEDQSAVSPDEKVKDFMDRERLHNLLDMMPKREREVLDMRFGLVEGEFHTLAQVADKLGISRERVRQIEEAALKKLKKFVVAQEKELRH